MEPAVRPQWDPPRPFSLTSAGCAVLSADAAHTRAVAAALAVSVHASSRSSVCHRRRLNGTGLLAAPGVGVRVEGGRVRVRVWVWVEGGGWRGRVEGGGWVRSCAANGERGRQGSPAERGDGIVHEGEASLQQQRRREPAAAAQDGGAEGGGQAGQASGVDRAWRRRAGAWERRCTGYEQG